MKGVTYELVKKIAVALNAEDSPPIKGGISFRIIVFKVKDQGLWVTAMLPDLIEVEELFEVVNESYAMFLAGEKTPNGVNFICAEQPEDLIRLSKSWYYGVN